MPGVLPVTLAKINLRDARALRDVAWAPYPVAFRVMGAERTGLRDIAAQVREVLAASPMMRTLPAMYSLWFKIRDESASDVDARTQSA